MTNDKKQAKDNTVTSLMKHFFSYTKKVNKTYKTKKDFILINKLICTT